MDTQNIPQTPKPSISLNRIIMLLLFSVAVSLITSIAVYYYLSSHYLQETYNSLPIMFPDSDSIAKPIINKTANWKTYTNKNMNISFKYPKNFTTREVGKNIIIDYYEANGEPTMQIFIHQVDKKDISSLLNLKRGKTYKEDNPYIDIITTRVGDQKLDGYPAYVFFTNQEWERLGPIKKYIINKNNTYYLINMSYFNYTNFDLYYPNNEASNRPFSPNFNYVQIFDQILSTFKFIE